MKSDANTKAIVECLRRAGASVEYWVPFGRQAGVPDLVVGFRGYTHLMEVKTKDGKPNDAQLDFKQEWKGDRVHIVRTPTEALKIIGLDAATLR